MNTKTKLTEVKENYTAKKRSKNANGEVVFEEQSFTRYKEVPYVTGWARFGGFMLDIIFILIFESIVGFIIGILLVVAGRVDLIQSDGFDLTFRLLTAVIIRPFFYILFEGTAQATPAKLILGRVVVNEYGEKPSFGQIVGRSYGRIVPFEFFSCLGDLGWHDTWSNTFVIRKSDLKEFQLAIKAQEFGNDTTSAQPATSVATSL